MNHDMKYRPDGMFQNYGGFAGFDKLAPARRCGGRFGDTLRLLAPLAVVKTHWTANIVWRSAFRVCVMVVFERHYSVPTVHVYSTS